MNAPITYRSFLRNLSRYVRSERGSQGEKKDSLFSGADPGNVGNVFDIPPSQPDFENTASKNAYGVPARILEVIGDDSLGNIITVSVQQESVIDEGGQAVSNDPQFEDDVEGPCTGIVEFGSGAGLSSFEFDIPSPKFAPSVVRQENPGGGAFNTDLTIGRRLGAAMLSLPASSLRILVRNDANAPYLLNLDSPRSLNTNKKTAKVRVHATYGRKPSNTRLTRTFPIVLNLPAGNIVPTGQTAFLADTDLFLGIPTYATKLFLPRKPLNTSTLSIFLSSAALKDAGAPGLFEKEPIIVPAGSEGPIDIGPFDTLVRISNPAGGVSINNLLARFELAI